MVPSIFYLKEKEDNEYLLYIQIVATTVELKRKISNKFV